MLPQHKIHGTKGEIAANLEDKIIEKTVFGKQKEVVDVSKLADDFSVHQGGDKNMMRDLHQYLTTGEMPPAITDISTSLESHFMAFAAEESRVNKGKTVKINTNY